MGSNAFSGVINKINENLGDILQKDILNAQNMFEPNEISNEKFGDSTNKLSATIEKIRNTRPTKLDSNRLHQINKRSEVDIVLQQPYSDENIKDILNAQKLFGINDNNNTNMLS